MRAGELRHRITLRIATVSQDDCGQPVQTWTDHATVWAAVEPLRGREYFESQQQQAEVTTRIRIRYRAKVSPVMRVKWGVRIYKIEAVIDPDERHQELQLMCAEVVT